MKIAEPPQGGRPAGIPLLALGFRPFYLAAAVFAALSVAAWALQFTGWLPGAYLAGPLWHAHEMVFGFALAVIVGFLFTAGRNWSGRPTPTGGLLAALVALWLAGRVMVLTPYPWAAALVNAAFPLAAAVALAVPFVASGNRRNYFFVGLLALLSAATLAVHLARVGVLSLPQRLGIQVGLDVVLFIMAVMGGRVIPMFTNNGVPGVSARRIAPVERAALGLLLALLVAGLLGLDARVLVPLAALAAVAHAARLWLWQPWRTLRVPLVWVLHAGYAWIPLHLALRALGEAGLVMPSLATHALTVGAIGGLTIGMMTRTALGHTGRPLRAGRLETACYLLVLGAALLRVFGPLLVPGAYAASVLGSAALWSAGYAVYAIGYWPVLGRPRVDGRPG